MSPTGGGFSFEQLVELGIHTCLSNTSDVSSRYSRNAWEKRMKSANNFSRYVTAGLSVAQAITKEYSKESHPRVAVFSGPGNNGLDGKTSSLYRLGRWRARSSINSDRKKNGTPINSPFPLWLPIHLFRSRCCTPSLTFWIPAKSVLSQKTRQTRQPGVYLLHNCWLLRRHVSYKSREPQHIESNFSSPWMCHFRGWWSNAWSWISHLWTVPSVGYATPTWLSMRSLVRFLTNHPLLDPARVRLLHFESAYGTIDIKHSQPLLSRNRVQLFGWGSPTVCLCHSGPQEHCHPDRLW